MLALVTCAAARDVDDDLPRLRAALRDAAVVDWDDDSVDWSGFGAVVIRSTWDYPGRRAEFLEWAAHVDSVTALWNRLDLIRWNTDKRYLLELAAEGVPITPTTVVRGAGDDVELGGDVVVKPAVGAGSIGVFRSRGDRAAARRHLEALLAEGSAALVQPYQAAIDDLGETGLVYVGGRFSHAFNKAPILNGRPEPDGALMMKESTRPHLATAAERELGDCVVASLGQTAYARVDLVPSEAGPVLMELELTEPSLFLEHDAGAAERAASVFRSLVT